MEPLPTIVHALAEAKTRTIDKVAVRYKSKGLWTSRNWPDVVTDIERIIGALKSIGVKQNSRVAILSETRYEWLVLDMAILCLGAQTVPIYPNLLADEVKAIIADSGTTHLFIDSPKNFSRLKSLSESKNLKILSIDAVSEGTQTFSDLLLLGTQLLQDASVNLGELARKLKPTDLATIVYTSGSMGDAKGVLLCHEQIISEIVESFFSMGITSSDTTLTFLPYAHIFGRLEMWGSIYFGNTLAFAENPDALRKNFNEIHPTVFIAVPRVFEKIYATMINQINTHRFQRIIFNRARDFGIKLTEARLKRNSLPLYYYPQFKLFDQLVFSKIRSLFGGNLRFAVSGGAPLSVEINRFFWSCGIPILEGYGLSETTGAVTVNRPYDHLLGSVGKAIGDVEIKLAEDKEILLRSKKIMKGYLNRPEETKDAFVDGFFKTGDFGELTPTGFLKITGRKKELIKTSGGKYISPQRIEQRIIQNPLIEHAVVIGDQKKYAIALLTLANSSKKKNDDPEVRQTVRKWISEVNNGLASFETIKNFEILPAGFSVESGELTPSLKIKRKAIEAKYHKEIEALY